MAVITDAPKGDIFDRTKAGTVTMFRWWSGWFHSAYLCCLSTQDSGTTANRPTQELWVGRRYFDTTLGKPVYLKSVGPNVWVDGVGTVS